MTIIPVPPNGVDGVASSPGLLAQYATPTGLNLPDGIEFDDWVGLGEALHHMERSVMWWIGDWWRYGERNYGESASQAAPTGYALQTVKDAAWVADRIESSRRRDDLTFSHHKEVASLPPTDAEVFLDRAREDSWTRAQMRAEVKRHKYQSQPTRATNGNGSDWSSVDELPKEFVTLTADPPWQYDNVATRGAAEDHYGTMSMDELTALDVDNLPGLCVPTADDAHLYLWVTNGFLRQGFELMEAWGFTYKAVLTWCKPQIGTGNYFRNSTEHVLFGLKGRLPTNTNNTPTWFQADRTRHSAKPECFYDLVEASSPGPYLELFSRRRRFGWWHWGNEA